MTITLDKTQEDWLRAQVETGGYDSVEQAVQIAIQRMMLDDVSDEDLMWAKPLVDEGLAQIDRGEVYPADEVFERIRQRISARK